MRELRGEGGASAVTHWKQKTYKVVNCDLKTYLILYTPIISNVSLSRWTTQSCWPFKHARSSVSLSRFVSFQPGGKPLEWTMMRDWWAMSSWYALIFLFLFLFYHRCALVYSERASSICVSASTTERLEHFLCFLLNYSYWFSFVLGVKCADSAVNNTNILGFVNGFVVVIWNREGWILVWVVRNNALVCERARDERKSFAFNESMNILFLFA